MINCLIVITYYLHIYYLFVVVFSL